MSRAVSGLRSAIRKATSESWRISLSVSCDRGPILSVVTSRPKIVAHLDLDAFFAAVEELEHPELRMQPLVVGGDPRGRGVVATANYVARQFGIHSAMSAAVGTPPGRGGGGGGPALPPPRLGPPPPLGLPRVLTRRLVDGARRRPDRR